MNIPLSNQSHEDTTVYGWEIEKLKTWTTNEIRNYIWMNVSNGQPIPGCMKVQALRQELINRGEKPYGYHNT